MSLSASTVEPARCLAIEDSDAGILVPDLKPPSPAAREAAFRVLTSLHEVVALLSQASVPSSA